MMNEHGMPTPKGERSMTKREMERRVRDLTRCMSAALRLREFGKAEFFKRRLEFWNDVLRGER